MSAALVRAAGAAATIGLVLAGCSPGAGMGSLSIDGGLLPAGTGGILAERRMNIVWAPEMTACGVCNAPVADALGRFAADYPQTGIVTALVADAPFPEDLVVGTKLVVAETESSRSPHARRPYIAILDAERQLLGWRRIPEFGRQDDFVYQELLSAYSLTAPLEANP